MYARFLLNPWITQSPKRIAFSQLDPTHLKCPHFGDQYISWLLFCNSEHHECHPSQKKLVCFDIKGFCSLAFELPLAASFMRMYINNIVPYLASSCSLCNEDIMMYTRHITVRHSFQSRWLCCLWLKQSARVISRTCIGISNVDRELLHKVR